MSSLSSSLSGSSAAPTSSPRRFAISASSLAASARRSPSWVASTSAAVSRSDGALHLDLELGLLSRAGPHLLGDRVAAAALADDPGLDPLDAGPDSGLRRRGGRCRSRDLRQEPLARLDPRLQRFAVALAEHALGAAGVADGALGAAADRPERRFALALGGPLGAGSCQTLDRAGQAGVDLPQLLLEPAAPLTGGAAGLLDLQRQGAELGAQGLEALLELGAAVGERGAAHGDPLLLAAKLGQGPPGLGPLAVAGGEALLGGAAALADLGEPLFDPVAGGAGILGGLLRRLRPVGAEPEVLADEPGAELELLAFDPRPELGGLGLALQRPQPATRLALEVERPVEVVARRAQLQLGPPAALAVLAEAGGLLDQEPPLARLRVDDRLDPALADHGVHLAPEVGVGEHLDDVDEAAAGAVEAVGALAGAIEAALDRDLGELGGGPALGVVDRHLDLGGAALADALAAGRDHVLHRCSPDRPRALLAEGPEDGVGDIRLAGPVGTDDHADARGELEPGPLGERLESLHLDRSQIHDPSSANTKARVRRRASRARAPRRPARPPSCCGRCRSRSDRSLRPRRPRRSARAPGPIRRSPHR